MRDFSRIQSKRIAEISMLISHRRAAVERLEGELSISKENVKIAKQELQFAYNDLDSITNDAASGIEPLPNLFEEAQARKNS